MSKYTYTQFVKTEELDNMTKDATGGATANFFAGNKIGLSNETQQANILYSAVRDLGGDQNHPIVKALEKHMIEIGGISPEKIQDVVTQGKDYVTQEAVPKEFGRFQSPTTKEKVSSAAVEEEEFGEFQSAPKLMDNYNKHKYDAKVDKTLVEGIEPTQAAKFLLIGKTPEQQADVLYSISRNVKTSEDPLVAALISNMVENNIATRGTLERISSEGIAFKEPEIAKEPPLQKQESAPRLSAEKENAKLKAGLENLMPQYRDQRQEDAPDKQKSVTDAYEQLKAKVRISNEILDIAQAAHSGGTNTHHQKGKEHIEPGAVDSVMFEGKAQAMKQELASSRVDAITQAVREEILAKQQTLLQNEIAKLDAATPALTAKAAEIKSPEYWYEDQDIKGILEKQLGNKAIILPALSNSQEFIQSSIGANLAEITKDKPAVIPINLGEKHWAAMSLHKDDKGDLVVFFNDPQGTPLNTSPDSESGKYIAALKKSMGEDKVKIIDLQTKQQTDESSCGPFTSANLIALAELKSDELNKAAAKAKITAVGTDASAIRQSHGEITLAENTSKIKDMKPEDFRQYLQSAEGKEKVANLCKKPEIQNALNAIEVEGYKKIHTDFKDSFKDVAWAEEQSAGAKTKSCEIKNDAGEIVANIKETTHDKAPIEVRLENGESVKVNSYRTIDFPTKLEKENGPLHLSMAVKDENGKNIAEKHAVYFTAHYDEQGKLTEVSSPVPVKFMGKGDDAIGYIERDGKVYTLPVTQGKYKEMMQEVSKNKGHGVDLSQELEPIAEKALAKDMIMSTTPLTQEKTDKKKEVQKRVEAPSFVETPPVQVNISGTEAEKKEQMNSFLKEHSPEQIVSTLKAEVKKGNTEFIEKLTSNIGASGKEITKEQYKEVYDVGMAEAKKIATQKPAPNSKSPNPLAQAFKLGGVHKSCEKLLTQADITKANHDSAVKSNSKLQIAQQQTKGNKIYSV